MWYRIINYLKNIKINNIEKTPLPGRWKLKYSENELELFYKQIPDPGYKN